ncbi:hypothetical protein ACFL0D_04370 [Thermoproteota archaeon]
MELRLYAANFIMWGQDDYNLEGYESAGEWFNQALEIDPRELVALAQYCTI